MSSERIDFKVSPPSTEVEATVTNADVLGAVLRSLAPLSDDARKRVLHAASSFYRVER